MWTTLISRIDHCPLRLTTKVYINSLSTWGLHDQKTIKNIWIIQNSRQSTDSWIWCLTTATALLTSRFLTPISNRCKLKCTVAVSITRLWITLDWRLAVKFFMMTMGSRSRSDAFCLPSETMTTKETHSLSFSRSTYLMSLTCKRKSKSRPSLPTLSSKCALRYSNQ